MKAIIKTPPIFAVKYIPKVYQPQSPKFYVNGKRRRFYLYITTTKRWLTKGSIINGSDN